MVSEDFTIVLCSHLLSDPVIRGVVEIVSLFHGTAVGMHVYSNLVTYFTGYHSFEIDVAVLLNSSTVIHLIDSV